MSEQRFWSNVVVAAPTRSKESVARRYSVTGVLIGKIVRRELWAHVA